MNGRNTGTSSADGCGPRPSAQSNSSEIGRLQAVPDLLDRLDVEPEGVGKACLASRAEMPTRSAPVASLSKANRPDDVEMVEHPRQHARARPSGSALRAARPRRTGGRCRRRGRRLALGRRRPEQRQGLGHVADIVAAHRQQDGVDRAPRPSPRICGRLHCRDVERAGQRRQRKPAVGIRRFLQIVADQLQLGVARARVDEVVEQLGESAHRCRNA